MYFFLTRGVTLHLVWPLYTVQYEWPLWYSVQNNTCWFSLSVCEYTVDTMLYVDIYTDIFLVLRREPKTKKQPNSHLQIACLMLVKNAFCLFLCPCLLSAATRWHWRVSVGLNSSRPLFLWHKRNKKVLFFFAESLFSATDRCDHRCICKKDDRERTRKKRARTRTASKLNADSKKQWWTNMGGNVKRKRERL